LPTPTFHSSLSPIPFCVRIFDWQFRKYGTKITFRAVKQQALLVNLLPLVPPSPQIRRYSARNLPNKINLQLSELEPRARLDSVGLAHQLQTRAQRRLPQQVGLGADYLVNNRSRNRNRNLSNQLSVDSETQPSNHSSRVEAYLGTRSVIIRLSQLVSQRLVVNNSTLLCAITD
jgi:hypothetical protein